MKKLRGKTIRRQILHKLLHPKHLYMMISLSRKSKQKGRSANDAQLKLYAKILQEGFLHYGFFEQTDIEPEAISLKDFYHAQHLYAEKLVGLVKDTSKPVLDVGCGLGGLMYMLHKAQCQITGLTPDKYQIEFIRSTFPEFPLLHTKFERMDVEPYRHYFGTVINSESVQYIKLDPALRLIDTILAKGGQWIVSDYFRIKSAHEKSGHFWEVFREELTGNGFKISYQEDITENIKPTLNYFHMWGSRFGIPLYEFLTEKLTRKNPAIGYLLDETLKDTRLFIDDHIKLIEPEQFMSDKKYMILVIERNR